MQKTKSTMTSSSGRTVALHTRASRLKTVVFATRLFHTTLVSQDRSDEFRDGEGTLLPLWRFSSEKAKKKQAWNGGQREDVALL